MGGGTREVHIVVVGSTNFDMVVQADRLPRAGENLLAKNLKFFSGGKGANQSVAVARLGARVTFLGAVGADVIGDFLIGRLKENGIDTSWIKRDQGHSTGCAFILILPNGENCIVVEPAANMSLAVSDIERAEEAIARADAVMTVLEVPLEVVEAALRLGRRHGKLTVLDAGPPRRCSPEVLLLADIVSPNETELEALSGERVSGRESAERAAGKLLSLGAKTVVVKLGAEGSMCVTSAGAQHFPACKVQAVDPTAAGDAFTAALAFRLAAGDAIERAIPYANVAGALAVTKLGAQPSLPTQKEVEDFARKARIAI